MVEDAGLGVREDEPEVSQIILGVGLSPYLRTPAAWQAGDELIGSSGVTSGRVPGHDDGVSTPPAPEVLDAFGVQARPQSIEGGEGRSWRAGDVLLKPVNDIEV